MPVPTTLASLSTTAASNSPSGGENPFPDLDDHIRQGYAFDAQNRDAIAQKLNASAVSAFGLTLVDDADAAAARNTLGAVGKTGDETVAGVKTFSSPPVLPGNASTNLQPVPKQQAESIANAAAASAAADALADAQATQIGLDQTLQSFTPPTRQLGTPYTNSTGRPIFVHVEGTATAGTNISFTVNGSVLKGVALPNAGNGGGQSMLIPIGATYSVSGSINQTAWFELR
jgi:hypothetical protein